MAIRVGPKNKEMKESGREPEREREQEESLSLGL